MSIATNVKEKPILFSGEMVRAILAGRKSMTRRVVKPQTAILTDSLARSLDVRPPDNENAPVIPCPYGSPGDHLWVRETFYCDDYRYPSAPARELLEAIEYRASHYCADWEAGCPCTDSAWRPSIHMPRWASRITLEIVSVRVERLQEISEVDAWAEGLFQIGDDLATPMNVCVCDEPNLRSGMAFAEHVGPPWYTYAGNPREAFENLWDGINNPHQYCAEDAPNGWDANPWVWVIEFKPIPQPQHNQTDLRGGK